MIRTFLTTLALIYSIQAQTQSYNPGTTTDKFNSLFDKVIEHYVDSVNGDALVEDAIRAMLKKLDPHSVYISKKDLRATNEPLKGNFDGIGIRFQILDDTLMVVSPISGGPSEKLGICAGDKIITVNGENIAGIGVTNKMVTAKLKGERGTSVTVGIKRYSGAEVMEYEITRDKIPIHSIRAYYMATDEIGYMKLTRFSATTMKEFNAAIADLKNAGMKSLILDLRGNGGGYLRTATRLSDEFLSGKKRIVYTEGRNSPRKEIYTKHKGQFEKGKLVVLIDQSSASASEIFSGSIQDWDRGLIIGRRSFGKGLVQKPMMLNDSSAIRLTISRYYMPSGRSIQKPYAAGAEAYKQEKYSRSESGELYHKDSIPVDSSQKFLTNGKRVVYGGAGIIPDIFVPLDTGGSSDYFRALMQKGIFNAFCLSYVNQNRVLLKSKYATWATFKSDFRITDDLLREFFGYAKKEGVNEDEPGYTKVKNIIDTRLKAQIAANLWSDRKFYEIMNVLSPDYRKAIESMNDHTFKKLNPKVEK